MRSGTGTNQTSIFLNGVRIQNGTVSNAFVASTTSYIGSAASNYYFNGYISNLRLVGGTALYDPTLTTLTVPSAPLTNVSGTMVLGCQSNHLVDNATASAITVTSAGAPTVKTFNAFDFPSHFSYYFGGLNNYLSVPYTSNFRIAVTLQLRHS